MKPSIPTKAQKGQLRKGMITHWSQVYCGYIWHGLPPLYFPYLPQWWMVNGSQFLKLRLTLNLDGMEMVQMNSSSFLFNKKIAGSDCRNPCCHQSIPCLCWHLVQHMGPLDSHFCKFEYNTLGPHLQFVLQLPIVN